MVGAGIARKVDFGEGRSRFEPAYRHPRHFHLICEQCHRSSEFLSSDIETLVEEIAAARGFAATQTVVQVFGTCEECRTGQKTAPMDGATTELVFARDALRIAIATERSGLEFYTRAADLTTDTRGRNVFQRLAAEEREHLGTLERRYAELLAQDPQLEARPTFLFFKGAAAGFFAEGRREAQAAASTICRRCSSASSASAARTSSSSGTASGSRIPKASRVFLEFAEEERAHLDLLIGEYRALRERLGARRGSARTRVDSLTALIDLHTHTTASDGRCTPAELVARAAAAARQRAERHRSRHGRRLRCRRRRRAPRLASSSCRASRSRPSSTARTCTCSATSSTWIRRSFTPSSRTSAGLRIDRVREIAARLAAHRHRARRGCRS